MQGLMIYSQEDIEKNREFSDWVRDEFKKYQVELKVLAKEELYSCEHSFKQCAFVINRSRDYNLSLLLELNQIRVYNNSQITLLGNNKLAGYAYVQKKGYPIARIVLPEESEQEKIISKPIYGHGGQGISVLSSIKEWKKDHVNQILLEDIVGDVRFYIIGNQVQTAVLRKAKEGVLSNFSLGGTVEQFYVDKDVNHYIISFMEGLSIDYAGIDFLLTKEGKFIFNEIEDVAGSRMLSQLAINNLVPIWVNHIIRELK